MSEEANKQNPFGFNINSVELRDFDTKEVFWFSKDPEEIFNQIKDEEKIVELPKEALSSKTLSVEMSFSNQKPIKLLKIEQSECFKGEVVYNFNHTFGFCMPQSENCWDNIIENIETGLDPNELSENVVLYTKFFADEI